MKTRDNPYGALPDEAITMGKVARSVMCIVQELADLLYLLAEHEYRKEVGKLPGSARTKRLRKKRRSAVLAWARNRDQE